MHAIMVSLLITLAIMVWARMSYVFLFRKDDVEALRHKMLEMEVHYLDNHPDMFTGKLAWYEAAPGYWTMCYSWDSVEDIEKSLPPIPEFYQKLRQKPVDKKERT